MIKLFLIFGTVFGFFGVIGSLEKIPVIDKLLQKGVEKITRIN